MYEQPWYAERHQATLTAVSRDILDYSTDRPFDLICTHNFFGDVSMRGLDDDSCRAGGLS